MDDTDCRVPDSVLRTICDELEALTHSYKDLSPRMEG
jgi:hypothetical protein